MKKGKDLIKLRLKCLINGDITFAETIEDFNHDLQGASISYFLKGLVIGSVISLLVMNHFVTK